MVVHGRTHAHWVQLPLGKSPTSLEWTKDMAGFTSSIDAVEIEDPESQRYCSKYCSVGMLWFKFHHLLREAESGRYFSFAVD